MKLVCSLAAVAGALLLSAGGGRRQLASTGSTFSTAGMGMLQINRGGPPASMLGYRLICPTIAT
jgi:hypothetical protein